MLETSARLLRLLTLLQSRREWTGPDLAQQLGVDVRTVRRDADKLRELGYEVRASSGPGGGYQFGGGREMPPLLLDDDEALAVAVALRTAASRISRLEDTALRVLAKLDQLLPKRLHRRLGALWAVTVDLGGGHDTIDPQRLTQLAAACRDLERLRFAYADHDGRTSTREVEPYRLAHTGRRWYLVAWDPSRADWRTFRVDRIGAVTTGDRFAARALPEDVVAYVSRSIAYAPFAVQARVYLAGSAAEVAAGIPPWIGVVEPVDDTRCILAIGGPTLGAVAAHLIMADLDFEVIEPPELVPHLAALAARLERAGRAVAVAPAPP